MFTRILSVILLVTAFSATAVVAQQWSAEQQEVWETIESLFAEFKSEDVVFDVVVRDYTHPDFVTWDNRSAVPGNLNTSKILDGAAVDLLGTRWLAVSATPLNVLVYDDVAAVHAYIRGYLTTTGSQPVWTTIRWTTVWKKENGSWLQVLNFAHHE